MDAFVFLSPENPFYILDGVSDFDPKPYQQALMQFLQKPKKTRLAFTQNHYSFGYDGYSFPGQTDSLNQGEEDALHSFVFSEEHAIQEYPHPFHDLMRTFWKEMIMDLRQKLFGDFENIGDPQMDYGNLCFSLSCNYFPATNKKPKTELRLDEHPDGSFMTILPFGTDGSMEYNQGGQWKKLPATSSPIAFNGYFTELLHPTSRALNHRVPWPKGIGNERFSFALFVLPNRKFSYTQNGTTYQAQTLFDRYLNLYE